MVEETIWDIKFHKALRSFTSMLVSFALMCCIFFRRCSFVRLSIFLHHYLLYYITHQHLPVLFQDVFGFEARHVGPIGLTPDVLLLSDENGYQAILDNKAYHKYTINNDHYNRMVHNYIGNIVNYSKSDKLTHLLFCNKHSCNHLCHSEITTVFFMFRINPIYTQLAKREDGKVEILDDKREEVREILSERPNFIDRPEQHEYFQRKYSTSGVNPIGPT